MRVVLKRARHFITCKGKFFGLENISQVKNCLLLSDGEVTEQLSMFSEKSVALSALTGEV